jgi:hypothetical protein
MIVWLPRSQSNLPYLALAGVAMARLPKLPWRHEALHQVERLASPNWAQFFHSGGRAVTSGCVDRRRAGRDSTCGRPHTRTDHTALRAVEHVRLCSRCDRLLLGQQACSADWPISARSGHPSPASVLANSRKSASSGLRPVSGRYALNGKSAYDPKTATRWRRGAVSGNASIAPIPISETPRT